MISSKTYDGGYHQKQNLILSIFCIKEPRPKNLQLGRQKALTGCNCDQNIPDHAVSLEQKFLIQSTQLKVSSFVHNTAIYENKQYHSSAQFSKCQGAYQSVDLFPCSSSGSVLSVDHLLQWLCWHPQSSEKANCNFAHGHDIVLYFDAKRIKYTLN